MGKPLSEMTLQDPLELFLHFCAVGLIIHCFVLFFPLWETFLLE